MAKKIIEKKMRKKIYKRSVDSIVKREAYHSPVLNLKKIVERRRKPAIFLLKIKAVKTSRKNYAYNSLGSAKKLNRIPFVKSFAMKIASCFLAIGLGWIALSAIGRTTARFADTEISIDNMFNAGTLFFSLYSGQDNFVSGNKSDAMEPCDSITRTIKIRNEGTIPLFYNVHFKKIFGDDDFCAYLELEAKLEGKTEYPSGGNSKLSNFNFSSAEALSFIAVDNWQFKISLPGDAPDSLKGKTCDFKFVFIGKDNLPIGSLEGFSDTKEISSTIVSADWDDDKKNMNKNHCSNNEIDEENGENEDEGENENEYEQEEYFVGGNLEIGNASEYIAKEDEYDSEDPEDSKEGNNVISDDNLQDHFVYHDSNESSASNYASGDGGKKNDNKKE